MTEVAIEREGLTECDSYTHVKKALSRRINGIVLDYV